ncbi:universal stress protein [Halogeometricum borinquense]|uniref:Universal stress family protein n=2 Tax=Halogeometricum borinquense TaxID=60847 RepID=E4NKU3_HALBP|nr:universal stress protein [Halogeometricum borinquense]ADQ65989.1 universal stress family protein [Halogeometricum borinquense DSM 11551]ELY23145.1 universal stress family protein [Halogeometricum borinquense DSM 11551]QIB76158.1 universal stress protein [Halogeometricum borinquense]QIQ75403.1 universal stress protein [Halogeometricum borinquense]RYJ19595.1 universal stress protein [Halogeometricum borinquense]
MSDRRPLDVNLVLVPVDRSEESANAVEHAAAIAAEYDAAVHAVHVLGGDVVRAIETGAVDDEDVVADSTAIQETAGEIAARYDVELATSVAYGFSTKMKLRHPGSVVLDTAEELGADFVVVPREPVSGDPGEVLAKAAEYVLLYASQPVLSV